MKSFLTYIISVLTLALIGLYVLDFVYTENYSSGIRNKFQYIKSLENTKVDNILLGSSRVENGLDPKIINEITNTKTVNLGIQASGILDLELLIKLIKEYNIKHKTIFIQIDYIYNLKGKKSNVLQYQSVPFALENDNLSYYFNQSKDGFIINNIPFIRYALTDQKNGLREFIAALILKKTTIKDNFGFSALSGHSPHTTHTLPGFIEEDNKEFGSLLNTIKKLDLKVVFFCSPFRPDTKGLDFVEKLKTKIPDLKDYSNSVEEITFFVDNYHLNKSGAKVFSSIFSQMIINNRDF